MPLGELTFDRTTLHVHPIRGRGPWNSVGMFCWTKPKPAMMTSFWIFIGFFDLLKTKSPPLKNFSIE